MKNDTLVLLTSNYPFGKGETFIEGEMTYLNKSFKKIIIISHNMNDKQTRELPSNIIIERFDNEISKIDKILSLKNIFSKLVKDEIKFIRYSLRLKMTFFKLKTLLISLYKSQKINLFIEKIIKSQKVNVKDTIFYSYWMDENALALANNDSIKKLCRVHGWDLFFERSHENYLPFRKLIVENVNCFSISQTGVDYLIGKINSKNIRLSRLGTSKLKLNDNNYNKTIVSCSNIIPLKRVKLIIDSISLSSKNIKWIHFGDGLLFEEMKVYAFEKGINFEMNGYISNTKILEYFQENDIDLFINLSTTEGIPVSIMEAYSCGIPAMATDVGGTSEIVNNDNGILLRDNPSKEDVASKIDYFFSLSKNEIVLKRKNAYEIWNSRFNAKNNYTKFTEIISNL